MPQDKTIDAAGKEINQGILSTKVAAAKRAGSLMPFDTAKAYATDKSGFHQVGEEIEAHPALIEKLIASGKATSEAPKKK